MNIAENILAKKYASAFFNLNADTLSFDDYSALKAAAQYSKKNEKLFFLLNTPTVPTATKQTILEDLLHQFSLPNSLQPLIQLVLKHQRLFLLPAIFKQITVVYEKQKKIMEFTISSSQHLDKNQLEIMKTFLAKHTNYHIIYKQLFNKKLIAGIRMQSDVYLWEYSVAKQLRALRTLIR
jgi:ATP synthase F1 delta subunit